METSVEETNLDVCTAQVGHRFGECIHHNGVAYGLPPFFCCLLSAAGWLLLCYRGQCCHRRSLLLALALTVRVFSLPYAYAALSSDCLAITLEMPFKDPLGDLQPSTGWNGTRSAELGDSTVEVIADIVHKLR